MLAFKFIRRESLAVQIALFIAAYVACAEVGHLLSLPGAAAATCWPPSGLFLAALILNRPGRWPAYVAAGVAANFLSNVGLHRQSFLVSLGFCLSNAVEALTGAALFRWATRRLPTSSHLKETLALFCTGILAAPMAGAVVGAGTIAVAFGTPFWATWRSWWVADAVGVVLVVPLVLSWVRPTIAGFAVAGVWRWVEAASLAVGLVAATEYVYGSDAHSLAAQYQAYPFLLWAGLRFGPRGVSAACIPLVGLAVWNTGLGSGPFGDVDMALSDRVVALQIYLFVKCASFHAVAAVMAERNRREEDLREALRFSDAVFENSPVGMQVFDATGISRRMNEAHRAFLGLPSTTYGVGRFNVLTDPYTIASGDAVHFRRAYAGETVEIEEDRVDLGRPENRWETRTDERFVDMLIFPLRGEAGGIEAVVEFTRDVTDRVRDKAVLRATEERWQLALEANNDGTWDWDLRTNGVFHSPRWKAILGHTADEVGDTFAEWSTRAHPDDVPATTAAMNAFLAGNAPSFAVVSRVRHKDGAYRRILSRGVAVRDEAGVPYRVVGSISDVTERVIAEERLRESEARFRAMADAAPVLIWMAGADAKCHFFNEPWLAFTGRTHAQELGDGWADGVHRDDLDACLAMQVAAFAARRPLEREYRLRNAAGEYRWLLDQAAPCFLADGTFTGFIGCCVDIDERKAAEQRLRAALLEKETLLKEVHHRVKNNLAVVMGLLNLQAGRIADPAARGMLGESHRRIHSMALVHETLYQSRDVSRIPAAEYVNTIAGHLAGAFGVGPDRVRVEMAVDDLALGLDAAVPFGLILNELVSNAFKHAFPADRRGTIRVAVRRDGPDHWTFEVGDDGVGLAKAFDPAQSRSLGLQLVDVLARQMNATLDVRNGVGTAFHLRIPFSPAERS